MSTTARGAESMFLDVKELAVHKLNIRKSYAPGTIDYHTAEMKQVEPLEVVATAELIDSQIRITGQLETKIERSEEHTSELQSHSDLVCRLLLEKKKTQL